MGTERYLAILICCEGKTAKSYFEIVADIFRVHTVSTIEIIGEKGSYKSLIDKTNEEREKLAKQYEIEPSEITCWAV
jgi:hypothetical protein